MARPFTAVCSPGFRQPFPQLGGCLEHGKDGMRVLSPCLCRRNIRVHLALSYRIPDRTTAVPPRNSISDA